MKTATITGFRQKMKQHLDEIQEDRDILILTGPKKKDFVVLTLETFNAMEETAHLLSTSANTKRLMESSVRQLHLSQATPKATARKRAGKAKSKASR
jgi:antitoxin YefM